MTPTKVLIGSENNIKIESVRRSFSKFFKSVEIKGLQVDSRVPDQPFNEETFTGAKNRAEHARRINDEQHLNANFFVGIEGGVLQLHKRWFQFTVIYILDTQHRESFGTTGLYELPDWIIKKLLAGSELRHIIENLTQNSNTKKKQSASGFLTNGEVDRLQNYTQAVTFALIPFLQDNLYFPRNSDYSWNLNSSRG
ncbi:MAG: inosine/xanthosine triphosphatase [Candidatus Poribacteria bacterium]|nr:inosine/xanthosine triphosphatase [Candidatus Poribacteria bacterium]